MSTYGNRQAGPIYTVLLTIVLLVGGAVPAVAGPRPWPTDPSNGGRVVGGSDAASSALSTWLAIGIGVAATLMVLVLARPLAVLVRRLHRDEPRPA